MARVDRHESERDRWEMVHAAPDPRLDGYVLDYCAYDERTASFTRRRELPSERVVIIVNLGRADPGPHRRVDRPAARLLRGHARHVRGHRDLRRPARRADRSLPGRRAPAAADADARADRARRRPARRCSGAPARSCTRRWRARRGGQAKFERLDEFFLARLDDALSPVPSVTRALGRLRASGGSVRVDDARRRSSAAAAGTSSRASASRSACRRRRSRESCASTAPWG